MSSLGTRLKQARVDAGLSQRALAKRSGLSQQLISKIESGLIESTTELFRLAESLHADPLWLATGKTEQRKASGGGSGESIVAYVPLVSWVSAGLWKDIAPLTESAAELERIPVTRKVGPDAFALRVQGDSMEPVFPNGSVIVVDPAEAARHLSYVVVRLEDAEQATFKQLIIDGGTRYLKPLNPRYPVLEIRRDATLCGVVKQMLMDFE